MDKKPSIYELLYRPLDIAGLAVLRMLFGIIIMWEAVRYLDLARLISKYTQANFHFKYMFFEWVPLLPTSELQMVHVIYGISGLFITLGIFYHFSILTAFFCIAYLFLLDSTNYLNHIYLVIVFTGMMFFIPSHKGWSLYAFFKKDRATDTVPGWAIWLIRLEIAIVYSYAALAKMNVDWINGMPLFDWIGSRATPTGWQSYLNHPAVIYFFTYGGLLYDLLIVPLLLNKKTRLLGFMMTMFFHLSNHFLFNIGIFPWFMMAATTIFFDPSWPRTLLNFLFKGRFLPVKITENFLGPKGFWQKLGLSAMIIHITFQALFPLRHFLYPGYVSWSEEGHSFAWHMKLRGKDGVIAFTVKDPDTGKIQKIDLSHYLTKRQITKMASRPDLILQFAHFLRDKYTMPGEKPAEIYAETRIRLNGRKSQRLVDPDIDLGKIKPTIFSDTWLLPIRQPVWNAEDKKNRFGPAFKKDDIAIKAIHKYDAERAKMVNNSNKNLDR